MIQALGGADAVAPDRQRPRRASASGRAGGSSRPPSCVGWRRSAGRPPPAARSAARSRPAAGRPRPAPRPAAAALALAASIVSGIAPIVLRFCGHVLADLAVAARRPAHEHAVLVDQRDRQAVDLRLGHVLDRRSSMPSLGEQVARRASPRRAARPRRGRSRARASAAGAGPGSNRSSGLPADALRRRVGRPQLGVLLLERAQLAQQVVVLGVRDLRVVEHVVAVVVVLELAPQLRGPRGRLAGALRRRSLAP